MLVEGKKRKGGLVSAYMFSIRIPRLCAHEYTLSSLFISFTVLSMHYSRYDALAEPPMCKPSRLTTSAAISLTLSSPSSV